MKIKNGKITFYRGDDDALVIALTDGRSFVQGDRVFFSVKASAIAPLDIFQIESTTFVEHNGVQNGACHIEIDHERTIGLECKDTYFYDVLIQWANGDYVTVVPPSQFKLVPGGSHDDNG